ncbi:hypothetical protein NDU88_008402 [Pleurodeles waltl]|uniref:Uncharacterized protein n=1 Tax=Pleurodeles waltl TaxID=8319 RepID=A0AAV7QQL6_PLEWA|nr:hypothetical protein NDU88_008402 [Pleurodeles waltl]
MHRRVKEDVRVYDLDHTVVKSGLCAEPCALSEAALVDGTDVPVREDQLVALGQAERRRINEREPEASPSPALGLLGALQPVLYWDELPLLKANSDRKSLQRLNNADKGFFWH